MLGIFGDSYATPSVHFSGWPSDLSKILDLKFESYAKDGTSIWYSYKEFLKNYKKYSVIVFVYSSPHRWAHLSDHLTRYQWVISQDILDMVALPMTPEVKQDLANLVKCHKLIFDEDLDYFLYQKVFEEVNRICRENNIKLVNLHPFTLDKQDSKIDFNNAYGSSITGMYTISEKEYLLHRQNPIIEKILENGDIRGCHLCPENNKVLANLIVESLNNQRKLTHMPDDPRVILDADIILDMIEKSNIYEN